MAADIRHRRHRRRAGINRGISVLGTATAASLRATGAIGGAIGLGGFDVAITVAVFTFQRLRLLSLIKNDEESCDKKDWSLWLSLGKENLVARDRYMRYPTQLGPFFQRLTGDLERASSPLRAARRESRASERSGPFGEQ